MQEFKVGDVVILEDFYSSFEIYDEIKKNLVGAPVEIVRIMSYEGYHGYHGHIKFYITPALSIILKRGGFRMDGILSLSQLRFSPFVGNDNVPENANSLCRRRT